MELSKKRFLLGLTNWIHSLRTLLHRGKGKSILSLDKKLVRGTLFYSLSTWAYYIELGFLLFYCYFLQQHYKLVTSFRLSPFVQNFRILQPQHHLKNKAYCLATNNAMAVVFFYILNIVLQPDTQEVWRRLQNTPTDLALNIF